MGLAQKSVQGASFAQRRTSLTDREHEVARLVAQGLTNPQIATTLTIGRRTVQTHVSHILEKLDLTSRAQLAAWFVQRDRWGSTGTARTFSQMADVAVSARS